MSRPGLMSVLVLSACLAPFAVGPLEAAASDGARDWPHWRGPARNGIVAEESYFDRGAWPPRQVAWETNVGEGSASPIVVAGRVYVMGWRDGQDTFYCLDAATGRELWKGGYAAPKYGRFATGDEGLYAAITSTPEFDAATGLIYTLGIDGHLNCWDTATRGRRGNGVSLYDAFGAKQRPRIGRSGQRDYGYTTAPLVLGDTLIVEVGSPEGTLMGFDKRTGRRRWVSESKDPAGHAGAPVPMTVEGVPCVAVFTLRGLLVARLDRGREGRTVAAYPWETDFAQNIATPAVHENHVILTSGYNHETIVKLRITLGGVEKVWEQPHHSKVCSPVIHKGRVYWVWERPYCLDFATGRLLWQGPRDFGDAGSCIVTADERLILFGKRGLLTLAETAQRSPGEYRELARADGLFGADVWPHVVLSDGRLLVKDRHGHLKCFNLSGQAVKE